MGLDHLAARLDGAPQLTRDPLGGGIVRLWSILAFLAMLACSHPRLCDVAPVPPFTILPDTAPAGLARGAVIALTDSAPLTHAQVHVDSTEAWAITDAQGHFALGKVRPGAFTLMVRMINYGSAQLRLEMPPDRGVTVRIPLVPRCFQIQPVAN